MKILVIEQVKAALPQMSVYLTIELHDFVDVLVFFIMQVATSQNKMKILDVVILLLSVVNAQSKYVYIHVPYNRSNDNMSDLTKNPFLPVS
jgi:hypothetical protein